MHRIYGAYKGNIKSVICEIIECSMKDAIELFLISYGIEKGDKWERIIKKISI